MIHISTSRFLVTAIFVAIVGLTGCTPSSQGAGNATTPTTAPVIATTQAPTDTAILATTVATTAATTVATAVATSAPTETAASTAVLATLPATALATVDSGASGASTQSAANTTSSDTAAACVKLNLNDTTQDKLLATIPSFSNRMVREFFEYRPYVSIQQFRKEIGKYVDANQVAEYEKYVYVPVDFNNADAATLMQIPGVTDSTAATLISGRPYASRQAFLDSLARSVSAPQLAGAGCYLAA